MPHAGFSKSFVLQDGREVGSVKRQVRKVVTAPSKIEQRCFNKHNLQIKNLTFLDSWKLRTEQKVHVSVATRTFASQNCKSIVVLRPLLEVQNCKECMLLWREAHMQVKTVKTVSFPYHLRKLRCAKVHAAVARSTTASRSRKHWVARDGF